MIGPVALLVGILAILGMVVRTTLGHPGAALYAEAAKPRIQRTVAHVKPHAKHYSVKDHTELRRKP
ncbi:hypothetical protein CCAX7_24030 [Capsulimonas corticalis]|uniref:Uncharacterized protein n=1 Tax=Capsulimonas corticalis TaxID=2219043 RepID=A0A402CVB6_9BACT|nr:hypothetical protein CCAX7_24030 [Capsulimonas corticalis]